MTAPLRKDGTSRADDLPDSQARAETSVTAEGTEYRESKPRNAPDRRLRNRILIANVVAWIIIIVLIRVFFV